MTTSAMRLLLPAMLLAQLLAQCSRKDKTVDDLPRLQVIDGHVERRDLARAVTDGKAYVEDYPKSDQGWTLLGWAYAKDG
jgi:hypothetical protein